MAVSSKPWGTFAESDYPTAEDFCRAALIDMNPSGQRKVKANCKLPVREPRGGPVNRNGVHAAAQRLMATDAPAVEKRAAAQKLIRLYAEMEEDPPESVRRMAR